MIVWLLSISFIFLSKIALLKSSTPMLYNFDTWIPINSPTESFKPPPPVNDNWKESTATLFVGIVDYRDKRCVATLRNLFDKARYPDRIHVGLVQQIHTEKDFFDCIQGFCGSSTEVKACPRINQIKKLEFSHQDSRGPTDARYIQQGLIENEEFCMQIDTHTDFVVDWDVKLFQMWGSIQNEYAILSTTLPDVSEMNSNLSEDEVEVPHLCQAMIDERKMIVNLPPTMAKGLISPLLSPLWSAGFSFSKCHAEKKVPNDPNLRFIYDADEFVRFARLWTRGYDVYSPNSVVLVHDYKPGVMADNKNTPLDPMDWTLQRPLYMMPEFKRQLYDLAIDRIGLLLNFPSSQGGKESTEVVTAEALSMLTRYGLGRKRSLLQLMEFTGIDIPHRVVFGDRCKELSVVPYEPDSDPWTEQDDIWGAAPDRFPVSDSSTGSNYLPLEVGKDVPIYGRVELVTSTANYYAQRNEIAQKSAVVQGNETLSAVAHPGGVIDEVEAVASSQIHRAYDKLSVLSRHRGKELWWIFQSVDSSVESLINHIDAEIGFGHGHRVVKLLLLILPVFCLVVGIAVWVLMTGTRTKFENDLKKI